MVMLIRLDKVSGSALMLPFENLDLLEDRFFIIGIRQFV